MPETSETIITHADELHNLGQTIEGLVKAEEEFNTDTNIEVSSQDFTVVKSEPGSQIAVEQSLNEQHKDTPKINDTRTATTQEKISRTSRRTFAKPSQGPPFICEECGHESETRILLASHRHRKHRLKERTKPCPKCGKQFNSPMQLERHLKKPYCGSYPEFTCEFCEKKCIGLANYNIHLRFHKREYPFVCHLCAKSFMLRTHLNTHVRTKHENQRFVCEYIECDKMFQTRDAFVIHMQTHENILPYQCTYCTVLQASKGRLRSHIIRSHNIHATQQELDSMLVGQKLPIKPKLTPTTIPNEFQEIFITATDSVEINMQLK